MKNLEYLFNRFMKKENNKYFTMTSTEKDFYKIKNEDSLELPFKQFLYKELMNLWFEKEEDYENVEVPEEILLKMNMLSTYLRGIGNNHFYLNEYFCKEEDMLTFKTLYDYDLEQHTYQERAMLENTDFPSKTKEEEYMVRLNYNWARGYLTEKNSKGIEESKFYYMILASLPIYIDSKLSDIASDYIDTLIPNEFKDGKENGKPTKGGSILDFKIDANGLEGQLDELNSRKYQYISDLYNNTKIRFNKNKKSKIWIIDRSSKNDPSKEYIFSDQDVLKEIRFTNWQEDIEKYSTNDLSDINSIIEEEKIKLISFLDVQFKDIMENYNPNIIKMKKKMKIIISDQAMEDISNIKDED